MFTKIWWVHTLFTKKDEKKEKKKVRQRGRQRGSEGEISLSAEGGRRGHTAGVLPPDNSNNKSFQTSEAPGDVSSGSASFTPAGLKCVGHTLTQIHTHTHTHTHAHTHRETHTHTETHTQYPVFGSEKSLKHNVVAANGRSG